MSGDERLRWPGSVTRPRPPAMPATPHPGRPPLEAQEPEALDLLVARFATACQAVGGTVHHLDGVDAVAALVEALATDAAGAPDTSRALLTWDADQLPVAGLLEACAARGLDRLDATVRPDEAGHAADLARLDAAAVGVTGADVLLADTGSLVVTSGAGRSRLASLLPPVHVAVVTRAQLVPSLGAWLADRAANVGDVANLVVITGPSRTADIEMTLTRGVHGPRAVHVVFVG